jgi:hypothetical protein
MGLCVRLWTCRMIVQSLPLMLVGGIAIVMTATRVLQLVQTHVLHVLPFGSLGHFSMRDVCAGIFVSGLFMMYFGECVAAATVHPADCLPVLVQSLPADCAVSAVACPPALQAHSRYSAFSLWLLFVRTRCACSTVCDAVMVKSSFVPFDCISLGAVRVLESEPTVLCDADVGQYARMRIVAAVTILAYVLGLPAALVVFIAFNWRKVQRDQRLRELGEGDSALTNPHFYFRRRFRKVYEDFRPSLAYWKVFILLRKLGLGLVVVLASGYVALGLLRARRCLFSRSCSSSPPPPKSHGFGVSCDCLDSMVTCRAWALWSAALSSRQA